MQFTRELISSNLMEIITSGLYDGNLNCLREYVQNSIDSKANNVEIYFENGNSNLIIKDNGSGMDKDELRNALGIGRSFKSDENVGWRGIGIWSGVSSCRKIVIITKKCNNNKYRIEIDNDTIRRESNSTTDLFDVMAKSTSEILQLPLGNSESLEQDHFTIVRLESILPTQKNIFSPESIRKYLASTIPAPFDKGKFLLSDEIELWLKSKEIFLPSVNVIFNNQKIFRNPTRSDMFFNEIIKKDFWVEDKLIAIGWFLTNTKPKAFKTPNNGIYFRKKGFTIGDEKLFESYTYDLTYHPWQYGEIHVLSKDIRETAARNSFEYNNPYIESLILEIREFIKDLDNLNHILSGAYQEDKIKSAASCIVKSNLAVAEKIIKKSKYNIEKDTRRKIHDPSLKNMEGILTKLASDNLKYLDELDKMIKTGSLEENAHRIKEIESKLNTSDNIQKSIAEDVTEKETPSAKSKPAHNESVGEKKATAEETINPDKPINLPKEPSAPSDKSAVTPEEEIEPLLNVILKNLRPEVKTYISKSKGLERFEMSATDSIRDLLVKRLGTSCDKKEIFHLSKIAYGWGDVTQGKTQMLAIDMNLLARNWRFGAMVYTYVFSCSTSA